jgi:hypothetical protein
MSLDSEDGIIYWQGKTEELWEKPVPVPPCPPQIPHGLIRARTRTSAVRPATNDLSHGTALDILQSIHPLNTKLSQLSWHFIFFYSAPWQCTFHKTQNTHQFSIMVFYNSCIWTHLLITPSLHFSRVCDVCLTLPDTCFNWNQSSSGRDYNAYFIHWCSQLLHCFMKYSCCWDLKLLKCIPALNNYYITKLCYFVCWRFLPLSRRPMWDMLIFVLGGLLRYEVFTNNSNILYFI